MTPLERFNRALQIRTALEELMTPQERDTYLAGIDLSLIHISEPTRRS